jgi:NitT/TauT family transport system ATP-binding protein
MPIEHTGVRDANYRTSEEYRATTDKVSRALQEAIMMGAAAQ